MRIDPFNSSPEAWLQKWFGWLLLVAVLVNAGGLWVTIMEPDGALYASIARTIARTGDFVDLRAEGWDWLDKPHFPFWMAALSFRVFGINSFAYKLPALLFWAAGAYYTYRFTFCLYGRSVAQLAVLIYVSAAHLVISNNDVRAEPYLTGLVIGSVYYFYRASRDRIGWQLVAGSVLAACAVMTKGPFVLVTIGSGFIVDWVLSKDWRQFIHPRWWVALGLIAIFILPELYCLYVQFDLHPLKTIFGRTGVSGIRWFFWDSQFGRFFNTGPIRGSGDPFFYLHTLLWAFLPWSLLLYAAIFARCRDWRKYRFTTVPRDGVSLAGVVPGEAIPFGAALISFLMFSVSRFQLPHYLNILYPFFAILTAAWLYGVRKRPVLRIVAIVQHVIALVLGLLLVMLTWWFHFRNGGLILVASAALSVMVFLLFRDGGVEGGLMAAAGRSFCMAMLAYAFVNFCLYPALMSYQAGSEAAKYLNEGKLDPEKTDEKEGIGGTRRERVGAAGWKGPKAFMLREASIDYSFEFYCQAPIEWIPIDSLRDELGDEPGGSDGGGEQKRTIIMFLPCSFEDSLVRRGFVVQEIRRFPNFRISLLTPEFLNYRTRDATLSAFSLIRVY